MSKFTRFIAIVRTDLLQKFRSDFFWIVLIFIAILTWISFPLGALNYVSLTATGTSVSSLNALPQPELYRGLYSSAWIGLSIAYFMTLFSTSVGFFVVRGSIARDIETNVWQLLSTSPMSKLEYLFARWCSYILIFTLLYLSSCLVGVLAQYVRAESTDFRAVDYIAPYFFFALPAMTVTAMFAVLFDIHMALRHTVGNIFYGFIWLILVTQLPGWFAFKSLPPYLSWLVDLCGYNSLQEIILYGLQKSNNMIIHFDRVNILLGGLLDMPPKFLVFNTQNFSLNASLGRYAWLVVSLCGVYLASLFLSKAATKTNSASLAFNKELGATLTWLTKLMSPLQGSQWGILFSSELIFILRTRSVGWWAALMAVWVIQTFGDMSSNPIRIFSFVMGVAGAWLLLLDIFSRTLLRDLETCTYGFIFTSVSADYTLLITRLCVMLALAWVCTLPAALRALFISPMISLNIIVIGASSMALATILGALSRNSRLFELLACGAFYMTYEGATFINVVDISNLMLWWHAAILFIFLFSHKQVWRNLQSLR